MTYFKKILAVTPARLIQDSVIFQSARIAKHQKSHVTFYSVAEEVPDEQLTWITILPPVELMANVLEDQQVSLNKSIETYKPNFSSLDTFNAIGIPFIEVTKKVQQDNYDLVILAAKANNQPRKRFFGSTTVHLMRKCPCPVLTIGSNEDKPIKRIVAAIDVYAPSEAGRKLNESILNNASNLAVLESAELHIIHTWKLPSDDELKVWGYSCEVDRLEIIMKKQQDRQQQIDQLIEKTLLMQAPPITKILEGPAQEKIPQYIKENDIDLLVMGTVCRTGIPGYFIGNTAESILSEVTCSVLTLKPEGFISPVE
jgi:nucleotide-binding universal stress UspA family protein